MQGCGPHRARADAVLRAHRHPRHSSSTALSCCSRYDAEIGVELHPCFARCRAFGLDLRTPRPHRSGFPGATPGPIAQHRGRRSTRKRGRRRVADGNVGRGGCASMTSGLEHVGLTHREGADWNTDAADADQVTPTIFVAGDATGPPTRSCISPTSRVPPPCHNAATGGGLAPKKWTTAWAMQGWRSRTRRSPRSASPRAEARACGRRDLVTGRARFLRDRPGHRSDVPLSEVWKLIVDRRDPRDPRHDDFGPRADDLAHLIAVMMHHHDSLDTVFELPWYHPTLSGAVMLTVARDARRQLDQRTDWPHGPPVPILA